MNKATLNTEMNRFFEFYAVVSVDGDDVYCGPAYAQAIYAKRDGIIWMENNGYELAEPDTGWHDLSFLNEAQPEIGQSYDVIISNVVYNGRGIFRLSNGHTIIGVSQYRRVAE